MPDQIHGLCFSVLLCLIVKALDTVVSDGGDCAILLDLLSELELEDGGCVLVFRPQPLWFHLR